MFSQKGNTLIILLVIVGIVLTGMVGYFLATRQVENKPKVSKPTLNPPSSYMPQASFSSEEPGYPGNILGFKFSPDGMYAVTEKQTRGEAKIILTKKDGDTICGDLVGKNLSAYPAQKKYFYQRGTHIGSWLDNSHFVMESRPTDEELYKYTVDAATCLADLSSLVRVTIVP